MRYHFLFILVLILWGCNTPDAYVRNTIYINGSTYTENLSSVTLEYQPDGDTSWYSNGMNPINLSVNMSIISTWDTSYTNDGNVTLRLNVSDSHQQSSYDYVFLTVNNLEITSPVDQKINVIPEDLVFNGTATGSMYENYTIRYTNDSRPYSWSTQGVTLINKGFPNRVNTTLATFNSSIVTPGTYYLFNISMNSTLGFINQEVINISFMGQDIYEPDDIYTNASWILTNNTHQIHSFVPSRDYDWVKFNATNISKYIVETFADNPNDYFSDTSMYLYDSDGVSYLEYDSSSGEGRMSKMEFLPERNDTYYVRVYNPYSYVGGRYNISVREVDRYYKGIIPNSYAHPFYTYDLNPYTCNDMHEGDTCNQSWRVNVQADVGSAYDFFAMYDTESVQNITGIVRVNISNYPPPTLSLIYPNQGASLARDIGNIVITVDTDVPANCRYSTNPVYSYYWDGLSFYTTGSTRHTMTLSTISNTEYNLYYICRNLNSIDSSIYTHSFDTTGSATSTSSSSGGGSSGGGSSGGGSSGGGSSGGGAPKSTGNGKSKTWFTVYYNDWLTWDPDSTIITNIKMQIAANSQNAKLSITELDSKPREIPTLEDTYRYINLSPENLQISLAYILFKVNRSWSNGKDVTMMRYNGSWKELDTMKLKEDTLYSYYRAITPGFSYFAVGRKDNNIVKDTIDVEEILDDVPVETNMTEVITDSLPEVEKSPDVEVFIKALVIVLTMFLAIVGAFGLKDFISTHKKRKEEDKIQETRAEKTEVRDIIKKEFIKKKEVQSTEAKAVVKTEVVKQDIPIVKGEHAKKTETPKVKIEPVSKVLKEEKVTEFTHEEASEPIASQNITAPGRKATDLEEFEEKREENLKKNLDKKIDEMKNMIEDLEEVPEPKKNP